MLTATISCEREKKCLVWLSRRAAGGRDTQTDGRTDGQTGVVTGHVAREEVGGEGRRE